LQIGSEPDQVQPRLRTAAVTVVALACLVDRLEVAQQAAG